MLTVHEVSALTGASIRALHHYDAIGLLKPTVVTEAGYRLYDERALMRLQEILLLRELEFPLRDIARILDSPGFDRRAALCDQLTLLRLRCERLTRLISLTENLINGGNTMDFSAFDDSKEREYAAEARKRWGNTAAWKEYEAKEGARTNDERRSAEDGLTDIFKGFGGLRALAPDDPAVKAQVKKLQAHITANWYECTDEILSGLGRMYVTDPRFKENIDRAGGDGTAEFAARAIEAYRR